ncbi:MAG: alcohol dehydrogenase catalytic domain-containing protein [Candidatus Riflebacteria bacterium]|nr:alcohol dehydrogenase catalytic domain-containing protein [Candidatus Riflebacteria bacterium]
MKAIKIVDKNPFVFETPMKQPQKGWSKIKLIKAGICRTDIEISKGYMDFTGIPGHEFIGKVVESDNTELVGKRVVGEINVFCENCLQCLNGSGKHCENKLTFGIEKLDGCFSEYFSLPDRNLHIVSDDISDDAAVFTEPLAAAYEILEQYAVQENMKCIVFGDGKLGILCAWVLSTCCQNVFLVGKHSEKAKLIHWNGVKPIFNPQDIDFKADLTVEATGKAAGLQTAIDYTKPRGTLILKSTIAGSDGINLAMAVVKEITIIGSRCGPFYRALQGLHSFKFPVERLISENYPLTRASEAFKHASTSGTGKVLLVP